MAYMIVKNVTDYAYLVFTQLCIVTLDIYKHLGIGCSIAFIHESGLTGIIFSIPEFKTERVKRLLRL